jgi:hypothetical protein
MLGMSRNDASQQQLAAKYRDTFMPYRNGYAIKPSRNADPIMITSDQRERLVEAYCAAYARTMRWFMLLIVAAFILFVGLPVILRSDLPQWAFMLFIFALVGLMLLRQRSAMRTAIAALGPRPSALAADYIAWQRQRLRDRPWSNILLPAIVVPVIALRWHTHLPPRDGDDYFAILMLAAFAALLLWAGGPPHPPQNRGRRP